MALLPHRGVGVSAGGDFVDTILEVVDSQCLGINCLDKNGATVDYKRGTNLLYTTTPLAINLIQKSRQMNPGLHEDGLDGVEVLVGVAVP